MKGLTLRAWWLGAVADAAIAWHEVRQAPERMREDLRALGAAINRWLDRDEDSAAAAALFLFLSFASMGVLAWIASTVLSWAMGR